MSSQEKLVNLEDKGYLLDKNALTNIVFATQTALLTVRDSQSVEIWQNI